MCDMGHEDEEEDDDSNNTNNNDDDDDDDDHVPQQQHTITCDHPRTRGDRGHRTRGQKSPANPEQQQDEIPRPLHTTPSTTTTRMFKAHCNSEIPL